MKNVDFMEVTTGTVIEVTEPGDEKRTAMYAELLKDKMEGEQEND